MPISITRVYTRLGDSGETALVGGRRVAKDSPRIVAYGNGLMSSWNAGACFTRITASYATPRRCMDAFRRCPST